MLPILTHVIGRDDVTDAGVATLAAAEQSAVYYNKFSGASYENVVNNASPDDFTPSGDSLWYYDILTVQNLSTLIRGATWPKPLTAQSRIALYYANAFTPGTSCQTQLRYVADDTPVACTASSYVTAFYSAALSSSGLLTVTYTGDGTFTNGVVVTIQTPTSDNRLIWADVIVPNDLLYVGYYGEFAYRVYNDAGVWPFFCTAVASTDDLVAMPGIGANNTFQPWCAYRALGVPASKGAGVTVLFEPSATVFSCTGAPTPGYSWASAAYQSDTDYFVEAAVGNYTFGTLYTPDAISIPGGAPSIHGSAVVRAAILLITSATVSAWDGTAESSIFADAGALPWTATDKTVTIPINNAQPSSAQNIANVDITNAASVAIISEPFAPFPSVSCQVFVLDTTTAEYTRYVSGYFNELSLANFTGGTALYSLTDNVFVMVAATVSGSPAFYKWTTATAPTLNVEEVGFTTEFGVGGYACIKPSDPTTIMILDPQFFSTGHHKLKIVSTGVSFSIRSVTLTWPAQFVTDPPIYGPVLVSWSANNLQASLLVASATKVYLLSFPVNGDSSTAVTTTLTPQLQLDVPTSLIGASEIQTISVYQQDGATWGSTALSYLYAPAGQSLVMTAPIVTP